MIQVSIADRLLAIPANLVDLPDEQAIIGFVCQSLLEIPGITAVSHSPASDTAPPGQTDPLTVAMPLQAGKINRGKILLTVSDSEAFAPYQNALAGFCSMAAVVLEGRAACNLREEYRLRLKQMVQERLRRFQRQIAEKERIEESLRTVSQIWRSTFDSMLDPVAYLDLNGRIEQYNRAFADFCGRNIKTLKGCACYDLIHHTPDHIENCPFVRLRQSGTRETMELVSGEKTLFVVADPVFAPDGKIVGVVHIIRDITDRKHAEEALAKSNERYRLVAETAHDFILTTDLDYNVTYANKAVEGLMGGASPVGLKLNDFTPPETRKTGQAMMDQRRAGITDVFSFEWALSDLSGRSYIFDIRSQLLTENGNPSGVLFVARDITERKEAEEERRKLEKQLFEAQKMEAVGTLAGGIAHDFNNILATIIGYAELARDTREDNRREEQIDRLLLAAGRAKDLITQILTFSRRAEHLQKPIDLKSIVKEEIKLLRATMPATIEIRQQIHDGAFTVNADITQMHQVILNIITNAAHALGEKGGTIDVRLARTNLPAGSAAEELRLQPGPYIQLSIADTGPGIDPDILSRIFEPFFTTKGVGEGTGLGLSVVYGIVKNHQGAVKVESHPGAGASFHIYLPAMEDAPPVRKDSSATGLPGGTETILFVDDEKDLAELARNYLTRLGYQITLCMDSLEALNVFQKTPRGFDLVITDMNMPRLSGSDLARQILHLRPGQPVILCTGYSSYMNAEKAAEMGIKSFLFKPVSRRDMAMAIRKALDDIKKTAPNQ